MNAATRAAARQSSDGRKSQHREEPQARMGGQEKSDAAKTRPEKTISDAELNNGKMRLSRGELRLAP